MIFDDESSYLCDSVWALSLLLLTLFNSDKQEKIIINMYINEEKVGE